LTRNVNETEGRNYLKKAENSLSIARIALTEGAYDSSVMNSIHSAINALDALSVTLLRRRASGAHTDALLEVKSLFSATEYSDLSKQFSSLMDKKNMSEYGSDLMSEEEARSCLKWAERIMDRVKQKIEKR
jgi:uncharacterized protein (UPF0332 family)